MQIAEAEQMARSGKLRQACETMGYCKRWGPQGKYFANTIG